MNWKETEWINDTDDWKINWWRLKLLDVRNPLEICEARSLVSEKLEDIIYREWQIADISRITSLISRMNLIDKDEESTPKTLCCMDDRVNKWTESLSIAWSWILLIKDLIAKGYKSDEIISFLSPIFIGNNIDTITSHQDCGAWGLFYNFLIEHFKLDKNEEIIELISHLEDFFPGIWEIAFQEKKILISWKEDLITAIVLKYVAIKCDLKYGHIELSNNSIDIPNHESRSIVIDLSSYNLTWFFMKAWVKPGYFLDASMFLDNIGLIEKITEEAIIWKLIAQKQPWICDINKMIVTITIEENDERQETIAKKIITDINEDIDKNFHDLVGKFEIIIIKIPKIKD